MVSDKQIRANRRNSKLSTGPNDTSKTRYNAVKHGITSKQVVVTKVDGIDAADRYDQTRAALREECSPHGPLEESMLDQVAVGLHLQRRLLAYENAVISRRVGMLLLKRNLFFKQDGPSADLILAKHALARLEGQGQLSDVVDATFLKRFIRERIGLSDEQHSDDPSAKQTEEPQLTDRNVPVQIQEMIDLVCAHAQCTEEELRNQLIHYVTRSIILALEDMERISQDIENCRAEAGLPDDAELNRILRYDVRISNRVFKNLHELQRLQANRLNGQPVATAAVDVTLTVDSPILDDSNPEVCKSHKSPLATQCLEAADITNSDEISLIGQSAMIQEEQTDSGELVQDVPEPVRPRLQGNRNKSLKLKDYLGENETAKLLGSLENEQMGS